MQKNILAQYDIAVIGGGHAGIEAAAAAARLGAKTVLFTMSLDAVGNLPCNPSIGGTAKGHLVRELDALGGVMGQAADATFLQSRMLNLGKGAAVHSLRVQTDRRKYNDYMKKFLEIQPNLDIKQAEITDIATNELGVCGVYTSLNGYYIVSKIIIATGTYLAGKIFVGDAAYESGPDAVRAASKLSQSLKEHGVELRRFKTGTPARVHRRSIDFSKLGVQAGDNEIVPFSFMTDNLGENKVDCYIAYTNVKTHEVIKNNLHRSPLYGGAIEGIGPRYCPSIEDKVVRFADKNRHQIFVEPCGENTDEMYLQGMSSSLPEEVQLELYRTIEGFENLEIMRPAYAIEYDCINPLQLNPTLEFKAIKGLYGAGQFNGTSGYEEAAAQGLLAGINAARGVQGKEQIILKRQESYLGTLVDDLVTKGVTDPYRMMTSRSEYRLYLRQNNADERLTPLGRELGLVTDERFARLERTVLIKNAERQRLEKRVIKPSEANTVLAQLLEVEISSGATAADLLRRPRVRYAHIEQMIGKGENVTPLIAEKVETEIKYEGYIKRQQSQIKQIEKNEGTLIPTDFDYAPCLGLRLEAREKLARVRPQSLGQALRVPGVSPADISCLAIELAKRGIKNDR